METDFSEFEGYDAQPELKPDEVVPNEVEMTEFTLEQIEGAERLRGISPLTLSAAFCSKVSGQSYDFVRLPMSEWNLRDVVKYATIMSGLSSKQAKPLLMGAFNIVDYERAMVCDTPTLKLALRDERAPLLETHTNGTLPDVIRRRSGVTVHSLVHDNLYCAKFEIPGYTDGSRPDILVGLEGVDCGRIVQGGESYVAWHNMEFNTSITYRTISPTVRKLAAMFYVHKIPNMVDDKGKILYRDRVMPPTTVKAVTRIPGLDPFIAKSTQRIQEAYNDPKWRPTWLPQSKSTHLAFLEWLMDIAYSPTYAPAITAAAAERMCESYYGKADAQFAQVLKDLGVLGGAAVLPALRNLCGGAFPALNGGEIIRTYKQVSDMVERHRAQERSTDLTTHKVDAPGPGPSLESATSVPAKIMRALVTLKRHCPMEAEGVMAFGTGPHGYWESTLRAFFRDKPISWGDIDPKCSPRAGGAFAPIDVTDQSAIPNGFGRGSGLVSDVFPGANVKDAKFSSMMANYLRASFEWGVIKLYLGSDLEGPTIIDGRTAPPYVANWAQKYGFMALVPGGGPHSQEYFLIFGAKDMGGWSPPKPALSSYAPVVHNEVRDLAQYVPAIESYFSLWLAVKCVDMIRVNGWKAAYARNGVYPKFPTSAEKGAPFIREPMDWWLDITLHLTPSVSSKAVTVERPRLPNVDNSTMFEV